MKNKQISKYENIQIKQELKTINGLRLERDK